MKHSTMFRLFLLRHLPAVTTLMAISNYVLIPLPLGQIYPAFLTPIFTDLNPYLRLDVC